MLNIYERESCFVLGSKWRDTSKDDFTLNGINSYYATPIEYNQELIDFEINYNNLKTKKVDIVEEDVIYFFKESKYPRFKFTSNCNNLKTIQIPKATYLVTPIMDILGYNKNIESGVHCLLTNRLYFAKYNTGTGHLDRCHSLYKKATKEESFIALLQDKFLIQGNNYRIIECKMLNNYLKSHSIFNEINDNIDKCITEENLEEYITSKNSNELTDDLYKSLNTMMQSKDGSSIELGIKMLNNFDVKKYALQIGSLLRLNSSNIANNKALTTVGFKNVMTQLGTTYNHLKDSDTLQYYSKLYEASSDNIDKVEIQKYVTAEIKRRIEMTYESCIRNINVPVELILEVK